MGLGAMAGVTETVSRYSAETAKQRAARRRERSREVFAIVGSVGRRRSESGSGSESESERWVENGEESGWVFIGVLNP